MLEFQEIELPDKQRIERHLKNVDIQSCQYSFANLFSLKEKYGTEVCVEDDALYIRQLNRKLDGKIAYFFPICSSKPDDKLQRVFKTAELESHEFYFFGVFDQHRKHLYDFSLDQSPDWNEYIYDSKRIFDLKGTALSKIRRGINQFWDLYGDAVEIEKITLNHIAEIKDFQQKWHDESLLQTSLPASLEEENRAIDLALSHFEELDLSGVVLKHDGVVEGYCYGSVVRNDTFDVIVQKANKNYRHIYKVLFKELLRTYKDDIQWTNMEEDIGIKGLRQLKRSYKPDCQLVKYTAIPRIK